jgi:hypothetical protein
MIEFVLFLSAFLIVLAVLAALGDSLDRRDAKRRNQARRIR